MKALKLDEEALLLRFYAGKAQAMCRAFHFPAKVAPAAVTYLQRFFTRHSVLDHHPRDVMLAAVYVACKVSQCHWPSLQIDAHSPLQLVSSHGHVCGEALCSGQHGASTGSFSAAAACPAMLQGARCINLASNS